MNKESSAFYPKSQNQQKQVINQPSQQPWDIQYNNQQYTQPQLYSLQFSLQPQLVFLQQATAQAQFNLSQIQQQMSQNQSILQTPQYIPQAQATQQYNQNPPIIQPQQQQFIPQQLMQQFGQMNQNNEVVSNVPTSIAENVNYNSATNTSSQQKVKQEPLQPISQPVQKEKMIYQKEQKQQRIYKIQQECTDYNFGFCINGPKCEKMHVKKSQSSRPKSVPEWYTQKIFTHFQKDGMTNSSQLFELLLKSVLLPKLQDTQSINFSLGTFSDVRSERSDPFAHDINLIIENTKNILKGRTRFFVVKSFGFESIQTSIEHSVWSTSSGPTKKLSNAFNNADHVVLIFSVNESRSFQGFGLMQGDPNAAYKPECFANDNQTQISFADNFKVQWVVSCDFPFTKLNHLPPNPMNENNPIKQSKNGQELPFKLGNYVCHLLYNCDDANKKIHFPLESYHPPQSSYYKPMVKRQQQSTYQYSKPSQMGGYSQGHYNGGGNYQYNNSRQQTQQYFEASSLQSKSQTFSHQTQYQSQNNSQQPPLANSAGNTIEQQAPSQQNHPHQIATQH